MKLSALIFGDELQVGNIMQKLLLQFCPEVAVKSMASTPEDAFTAIHNYKIDVLFLDINLGNTCNGFELLDKLYQYDFDIVFISAHTEYVVKAFAYDATHYLRKPADYHMLIETIYRMKRRKETTTATDMRQLTPPSKIALSDIHSTQFVSLDDIAYLESNGSYTVFHLRDKQRYTKSRNLKYFEDALGEHTRFVRVHKSFIVNKAHIKGYRKSDQHLELFNGAVVPAAIGYRALVAHLGDHLIV